MLGNRYAVHSFATMPQVHKPRSKFDRSFSMFKTMDFDKLQPIYIEEVLPGDTFNVDLAVFARLQTQVVPLLDNAYIDFFYFFVPNRLVWTNWERFMGSQDDPTDTTDYLIPTTTSPAGGFAQDSWADHFGLPIKIAGLAVNALPFRGMQLIWNQWFRDQNMQDSFPVAMGDGPDNYATLNYDDPIYRGKRHDPYTSALPFPQKGPDVLLPLGTTAPIEGIGTVAATSWDTGPLAVRQTEGSGTVNYAKYRATSAVTNVIVREDPNNAGYPGIWANLEEASSASINSLREAWMLQSMLEIDARYGTRYIESIYGHFGVISPDFRLQRPEYLGGGEIRIVSHPVAQTSESATNKPQANLASFATAQNAGKRIGFSKSFVEHGFIIGLAAARADLTYQQGIVDRFWMKSDRYDFYVPALAGLGEQPILAKEIYAQGTADDDIVFGYQEAWWDYRSKQSVVTGEFRSTATAPLDMWHLAQKFTARPELDDTFIVSSTPISRNVVVNPNMTKPLLMQLWHQNHVARVMPVRSIPAQIGRF